LTLAAIVKCRRAEAPYQRFRATTPCSSDGELMMEAASTYRAIQAVGRGRQELAGRASVVLIDFSKD
jgi:hypothetical protein